MTEDVAFAVILSLGEPGVLIGDGTMPYPGNSRVLDAPNVAEMVKETELGKIRPLLGELAVPGTSGWLEMPVCSGTAGMLLVNKVAERPPVPCAPAAEYVEIDVKDNDGCENEMMV